MVEMISLFAFLGGLAVVLANIALWSPRKLRIKLGALAVTLVFLPTAYLSLSEMLSRPKPVDLEWARQSMAEATVMGSRMEEGKAIYLWLGFADTQEPRAYVLPWSQQMAQQLHGAQRQAEENGATVRMRRPFQASLEERERIFYAPPPPPPPLKQVPTEDPLSYQRSQNGS